MEENRILKNIVNLLNSYLHGKIKANLMIKKYDEIISEHYPWGTKNKKLKILESFQDELAFYVENPEWRKQDENYYGTEDLDVKIKEFLSNLEN